MQITAIEAIPFELAYREPLQMAAGDLLSAEHVLVRVHTDAGITGEAEAPARPMFYGESVHSIYKAISDWFAPQLIGLDPFNTAEINGRLNKVTANNTAKAALDIAMYDIQGKFLGIPVQQLLGGYACPLRVTHMLGHGEPEKVGQEAALVHEDLGITAFKVKIGYGYNTDLEVVAKVREAVGDDSTVYVDANQAYGPEEALTLLETMRQSSGIAWVEEPNRASDFYGRRRLADRLSIPIMGDESCPTIDDVAREVTGGSARYISIKVARTGFTQSRDIAALVSGLGGKVLMGSQGDSSIGTLAGLAFGAASPRTSEMPAELSYFTRLLDNLLVNDPVTTGGMMMPSMLPGLGIEIDEDKLSHYRTDLNQRSYL